MFLKTVSMLEAVRPADEGSAAERRLLSSVVTPGSRKRSSLCDCSKCSTLETRQLIPQPGTAWKSWQYPSMLEPSSCYVHTDYQRVYEDKNADV